MSFVTDVLLVAIVACATVGYIYIKYLFKYPYKIVFFSLIERLYSNKIRTVARPAGAVQHVAYGDSGGQQRLLLQICSRRRMDEDVNSSAASHNGAHQLTPERISQNTLFYI